MGGAQAIAALALRDRDGRPVDVIVGPGNLYVQEAKRQVFGQVGIDGFAGPSDLLVIARRADADAIAPIALDLLAQAEHGPGDAGRARVRLGGAARAFARPPAGLADTGADRLVVGVETLGRCARVRGGLRA